MEKFIYDLSVPGRRGVDMPEADVPLTPLPTDYLRKELALPEIGEPEVVRHYVRLSQLNYAVDKGMYPLGSCTMKYNPKVNERMCRLPGLANLHPLQDAETVQGAMGMMYELQTMLAAITGFSAVTLQPAAGAHGELTGVLIMRKAQLARGQTQRNKILVPDSAHGTNPATTTMAGLEVIEIPSAPDGNVDITALKAHLDDKVVGLMITNPNTLGIFEQNIVAICQMVHDVGGLVYGDGANLNAIMGIVRPADLGIDVMHFNLHKTFSVPHGGGGPGAGPVGVVKELEPFLPGPIVGMDDEDELLLGSCQRSRSVGSRASTAISAPLCGPTSISACTAPPGCERLAKTPCSMRTTSRRCSNSAATIPSRTVTASVCTRWWPRGRLPAPMVCTLWTLPSV